MSIVQEAYVGYHYRFEKSADANVGHRPVTGHHGHATLTFVKGERRWSALRLPQLQYEGNGSHMSPLEPQRAAKTAWCP